MIYVILGSWEYKDQHFYGAFLDNTQAVLRIEYLVGLDNTMDDFCWDHTLALVSVDPLTGKEVARTKYEVSRNMD